ncbi:MAG: RNA polymerase sigma factor [Thermoguttaceae bacterium]
MDEAQTTRHSLLLRLDGGSDKQAWSDFVDLYSPVVYGFARRQGLQDADAADLVQEVLGSVARSVTNYDRQKGRFRSWLMAVVRHRLSEFWAQRGRQVSGSGDTSVLDHLRQVSGGNGEEEFWEAEYQRSVLRLAVVRVRDEFEESTWRAFWSTHFEGQTTRQIAQLLGISEGAVYIARSRVTARLRKHIEALED